jgi:hypothetical protein
MVSPLHLQDTLHFGLVPPHPFQVTVDHTNRGRFQGPAPIHLTGTPARVLSQTEAGFVLQVEPGLQAAQVSWSRQGVAGFPEPPLPPYWSLWPDPDLSGLDCTGNQLHVLCPAGVGDFLWLWSKWWKVAADRPVTFWFPEGEQQRAGQLASLVGARHGYLPGLHTEWVWNRPGNPPIPTTGGVLSVHANLHLELGYPLRDWYPELPLRCPDLPLPQVATDPEPYVLVFTCHEGYMEGNLDPRQWAEMLRHVERTVAPCCLVGAGRDVPFGQAILAHYRTEFEPLFNRPLLEVLLAASRARAAFGVAGGPLIAAMNVGCPAFIAYPTWLGRMPGTWEPEGVARQWCFTPDLPAQILGSGLDRLLLPGA